MKGGTNGNLYVHSVYNYHIFQSLHNDSLWKNEALPVMYMVNKEQESLKVFFKVFF